MQRIKIKEIRVGGKQDFEETTQSNSAIAPPANSFTKSTSAKITQASSRGSLSAAGAIPNWEMPKRGDHYFHIRISRNTTIAILLSLLVHLMLLISLAPTLIPNGEKTSEESQPITVNLSPPPTKQMAQAAPAPSPPQPEQQAQPKPVAKPKPKQQPVRQKPQPDSSTNKIIALEKPAPDSIRQPINPKLPPPLTPESPAPTDMQSYINAARAKRQAEQGYTPKDSAEIAARDNPMSESDKRDAIIKRNLQQDGTNGIFQIREIRARTAQFSFKGWKNSYSTARQEIVEVEAGPDGDINRAIVKKMIAIIRRDYNGDFNWESQRMGRTIVLSARQEDNAGLEDFLIKEFFGTGGLSAR